MRGTYDTTNPSKTKVNYHQVVHYLLAICDRSLKVNAFCVSSANLVYNSMSSSNISPQASTIKQHTTLQIYCGNKHQNTTHCLHSDITRQ